MINQSFWCNYLFYLFIFAKQVIVLSWICLLCSSFILVFNTWNSKIRPNLTAWFMLYATVGENVPTAKKSNDTTTFSLFLRVQCQPCSGFSSLVGSNTIIHYLVFHFFSSSIHFLHKNTIKKVHCAVVVVVQA